MTRPHVTACYQDGHVSVVFCKVCGAEGLELLEDCPRKISDPVEKTIDVKNQTAK